MEISEGMDSDLASGQDDVPAVVEVTDTTGAGLLPPRRLPPLGAAGTSGIAPSLPQPATGTSLPPGAHV